MRFFPVLEWNQVLADGKKEILVKFQQFLYDQKFEKPNLQKSESQTEPNFSLYIL